MRKFKCFLLHSGVLWLLTSCFTIHRIHKTTSTRHSKQLYHTNQTMVMNITPLVRRGIDSSQLSTRSHVAKSKSVYYIVTLPVHAYFNPERLNNVHSITSQFPEVTVFRASHYLDVSCLTTLSNMHVTVSPLYKSDEKGIGWVHAGKIGHWCSFLRFIVECD